MRSVLLGLTVAILLAWPPGASSQIQRPSASASAPASGKTPATGPAWSQLTPAQQQALAPLASSWNTTMSEAQKRKWLEISKNYGTLAPQAQATLNSRMNEWVALSPQQRAQARLNFGKTLELSQELSPEEKKAKWEAYQALSPEEKQKLAATASPKPSGAATAIKPVAPQKLATVPAQAASGQALKPAPKISPLPATPVPAPTGLPVPANGAATQR
ncbi:MAG: putative transrane protein [Polaromonas sp.]|nr:putative transrane protein [Polaromonas sp.]